MKKELEMYELTLDEIKLFDGKQGIYGLIYDNQIIYVGQSVNLGDRLRTHRRANTNTIINKIIKEEGRNNLCKTLAMYYFIDANRDDMYFVILEETQDLNNREYHYISLFQPKFNYKGVDVPYFKQ